MTLQQIHYILEIARCGSISKAAQELCLTQPYLSSTLKDLESELHISLFSRGRKGSVLTKEGSEFLYYAKTLLEQEKRILELYNRHTARAPFHFSASMQRYPFVIKAFCQFFEKQNPDQFEVSLRECSMDRVIRDVSEQKSEVGIIFLSSATNAFIRKYLATRNLEFNEILSMSPCVFFRKKHPMAVYKEIDLDDMQDYPFASFESEATSSVDFSEEAILPNNTLMNRRFHVIDRGTMINILTHTNAFSIGTGILSAGFAGPELVSRPIKNHYNEICLGWIQMANTTISDEVSVFIKEMEVVLRQELSSQRDHIYSLREQ